jgi:predicted transposase YbfD/YdcC
MYSLLPHATEFSAMTQLDLDCDDILAHFHKLEDPRADINRKHPLVSVIVIAILAVLAGCNGPTAIARWAKIKHPLLKSILNLPHGIPGKDVFRRIFMLLKPNTFQDCFVDWITFLRAAAAETTEVDRPILPIDGKTHRRSHDRANGLGALHSVSVWASEYGLVLGQVACAEKSNEITAIPEVLKLVDVEGAIVTTDAMGTQKAIAKVIIEEGADYVLALKANHEKTHTAVIEYLEKQAENDFADIKVRRHTTTEMAHGRETTRSYIQVPAPKEILQLESWLGLKTIGMVMSTDIRNGKENVECRYYLNSLAMGVKTFARAVRGHWGIENGCHWSLDMTFREDESRIRENQLRQNFGHFSLDTRS